MKGSGVVSAQARRSSASAVVRWWRVHHLGALAALAIAVQLAVRAPLIAQSWFYADDYLFFGDIGSGKADLAWYFRFHFQHFMPLSFVLVKLASMLGPFNWLASATFIVTLQLAASLSCWWMLRTLFGRRPGTVLVLVWWLATPLTMPSVMWWAVSVNQLPQQIAFFGAVAAHVRFIRTRRLPWAVLATVFLVIGYGTYTKTILVPVVLALLSLVWFADGSIAERVAWTLRREWRAWLLYGGVTAAYVLAYVLRVPAGPPMQIKPAFLDLSWELVERTLVPSLAGGPARWQVWLDPMQVADPPVSVAVIGWLVVVSTVGYAWLRRDRSLRALSIPAVYVAVSLVLMYVSRLYVVDFTGTGFLARHVQYLADAAGPIALALGLMFLPLIDAPGSSAPRRSPLLTVRAPRVLVGAVVSAVVAMSIWSSIGYTSTWRADFPQRAFHQAALRTLESAPRPPALADSVLPPEVVNALAAPNDRIAVALSPVGDQFTVHDAGVDLELFSTDGSLVLADVDAEPRTTRDPSADCPYEVDGEPRTISFAGVLPITLWVAMDYQASTTAEATVVVGDRWNRLTLAGGRHRYLVRTNTEYDSLTIWPGAGQRICVESIRIGYAIPGERRLR